MWNEAGSEARGAVSAMSVRQESPLVGVAQLLAAQPADAAWKFHLTELPFRELVSVRGDVTDPAFVRAVHSVLGCEAPAAPNTTTRGDGHELLWLGPDEWLARSLEPRDATLERALRTAFEGLFASAVDVGSGYTVLAITGERVREVLARGCPLDTHPRVLRPGQCAQSHYFKASMTVVPSGENAFELVVRRSFADYFVRMMLDAAAPLMS